MYMKYLVYICYIINTRYVKKLQELAYKILCFSMPNAYMIFADRESFERSWKTLMDKEN